MQEHTLCECPPPQKKKSRKQPIIKHCLFSSFDFTDIGLTDVSWEHLLCIAHFTWHRPRKQEMSHLALKLEQKHALLSWMQFLSVRKLTLTPSDTVLVMHCIRIAWSYCIPTLHINSKKKDYNVIPGCHHVAKKTSCSCPDVNTR